MRRLLLVLAALFVPATPADAAWVWPVKGDVITPYRNGTDPYAAGQHRGIDIAASVGTPVVAAAAGDVRFAGTASDERWRYEVSEPSVVRMPIVRPEEPAVPAKRTSPPAAATTGEATEAAMSMPRCCPAAYGSVPLL